jgi:hypothetical protein
MMPVSVALPPLAVVGSSRPNPPPPSGRPSRSAHDESASVLDSGDGTMSWSISSTDFWSCQTLRPTARDVRPRNFLSPIGKPGNDVRK